MTVTDIAKLANVSIATVDRVLHNRGRVAETTKKRIEQIIKDSGYQPDPLARHLKKRGKYKIGVVLPKLSTAYGYWEQVFSGIQKTAEQEFSAFSFSIQLFSFIRSDVASLAETLAELENSECDAFIIAPVMEEQIKNFLYDHKVQKPYCFIDSPLPDCKPLSVIAQNPFSAGYLAGRLTQMLAKQEGTYIAVKPFTGAFNLDQRGLGFCEWFKKNPSHAKIVTYTARLTIDSAEAEVRKIIAEYPDLTAICVVSVETFLLAKAVQKLGLKKNIIITGFDLVENNKIELKNKNIDALIDQNPFEQGSLSVRQLFKKLVYEEEPEKEIHIPLEIYIKENLI
ncbi:MAG: LacI family DNA-binding transcriptional regulator [Treponema sp.]|nr:LacI family DNA-binding transcriptional regulator [Treponema sp.]